MNATITPTRAAFEHALAAARKAASGGTVKGMAAPLDASLLGMADEIWEKIEAGLQSIYLHGREQVASALSAITVQLHDLLAKAGQRAALLQAAILEKLQAFVRDFIETTLLVVQPELTVAGKKLPLANITVTHSFMLGGTIELSLTRVFELATEGEFQVQVEYALPR